ncbi:MAG: energy-coupling factor transporter ATPase [Clostridia bacterium]|nr:energy-coupling factor transporter ATPase [Clostridia bacterium]
MVIKVEGLSHIYNCGLPDERYALKDVNFEIRDKEFTAIIGHTGSGKSTLIQHLNGLIKPHEGKIFINGIDITQKGVDIRQIRQKVGLVFQYPEHQLFEETVCKDIAFGPKNLGLEDEEIKKRVLHACELVNIEEKLLEKSPFEISGGQKRRVAIAGVLSMQPEILILDEPTAGLDPKGRDKLLSVLEKLKDELTVVLVSHSMEDVARVAKNIIVMNKGTVYKQGSVAEIFADCRGLEKIGLNIPQITQLINRLNEFGAGLPQDIYTVGYAAQILKDRMGNRKNV